MDEKKECPIEGKCSPCVYKIVVAVLLLVAVGVTLAMKFIPEKEKEKSHDLPDKLVPASVETRPCLVELGAGKCASCKAMKPVLESFAAKYSEKIKVDSIDVWENEKAAEFYKVAVIPTQIFLDSEGKELFRHTGFFSEADIVEKWIELGIKLDASSEKASKKKE